jgi:putative endonuclease
VSALDRREAWDRGREAEAFVARDLEASGWVVLARNFRAGGGEIDLVVARGGEIRFVEVKARGEDGLDALESIGTLKRRRLTGAAEAWLALHGPPERSAAFLVAVVGQADGAWSVEYWDDAF